MADYPFFPVFVDLSARRALVVGGGRIAARRVNALAQFCPNVTVVAPAIHPDIALNAAIAGACRERRIPVNDASDRSRCDFLFPGIARRGVVVAGVTAGGEDHALARRATEAVRRCLERDLEQQD